eukprot:g5417.t1
MEPAADSRRPEINHRDPILKELRLPEIRKKYGAGSVEYKEARTLAMQRHAEDVHEHDDQASPPAAEFINIPAAPGSNGAMLPEAFLPIESSGIAHEDDHRDHHDMSHQELRAIRKRYGAGSAEYKEARERVIEKHHSSTLRFGMDSIAKLKLIRKKFGAGSKEYKRARKIVMRQTEESSGSTSGKKKKKKKKKRKRKKKRKEKEMIMEVNHESQEDIARRRKKDAEIRAAARKKRKAKDGKDRKKRQSRTGTEINDKDSLSAIAELHGRDSEVYQREAQRRDKIARRAAARRLREAKESKNDDASEVSSTSHANAADYRKEELEKMTLHQVGATFGRGSSVYKEEVQRRYPKPDEAARL